ncbi:MAG: TAXI family TRAP transporter solute-binding subunit [Candidatus Lernaella stagnicola]|nr:TAXI family TRAP transporter solute-binding subunit [Candidatus Lernaella stagnicola]
MMKTGRPIPWILVLCFVLLPVTAHAEKSYVFASGPAQCTYFRLGEFAASRDYTGFSIHNLASAGSVSNLDLLMSGKAQFALTQQDVLSSFLHKNGFTKKDSPLKVVGAAYYEYLHILVRTPLRIENHRDFRGMRVWLGAANSGTHFTARRFLDVSGIPLPSMQIMDDKDLCELTQTAGAKKSSSKVPKFDDIPSLFRRDQLDVAMLVVSAGAEAIKKAWCSGDVQFFEIQYELLRNLTIEGGGAATQHQTFVGEIPAGAYSCPGSVVVDNRPFATIVVPALLVTKADADPLIVQSVWQAVQAGAAKLEKDHELLPPETGSPLRLATSGLPLWREIEEPAKGRRWTWLVSPFIVLVILLAMLIVVRRKRRQIQRFFRNNRAISVFMTMVCIVLVSVLGTYLFEHNVNKHFSNPAEAFWSVLIYFTSGMEDRVLYTTGGKLFAIIALLMGPAMVAVLTGYVASRLVINFMESKMPHRLTDHFLILNWNPRAVHIIKQLKNEALHMESTIIVVSDDTELNFKNLEAQQKEAERREKAGDRLFEDVYFSAGDPTDSRALINANIQDARGVLVLADRALEDRADEKSIRTLFAIQRTLAEIGNGHSAHVVVELVNLENNVVVDEMAKTFPGTLEAVASTHIRTMLISQSLLQEGIVSFYRDLLEVTMDSNEVHSIVIPKSAAGWNFPEYASRVLAHRIDVPLIPVALIRRIDGRHQLYTNPKPGSPGYVLEEGDKLLVVSYEAPEAQDLPDVQPLEN